MRRLAGFVALVATVVVGAPGAGAGPGPAAVEPPAPVTGGPDAAAALAAAGTGRGGVGPASGDFDGDGFADLALGTPFEDVGFVADAGTVTVVYGGPTRLVPAGAVTFQQGELPIPDAPEPGDWFGSAVAAGDFDGDGFDDLAVGAMGEDRGDVVDAGSVTILHGGSGGLGVEAGVLVHQGINGVAGRAEPDDFFGSTVATGDVDGDGFDDLAVGATWEDIGTVVDAGNVTVIPGEALPGGAGSGMWQQGTNGVAGTPEAGDVYSWTLVMGDVNGDGFDDLVVAAPWEDSREADTGNVTVSLGGLGGLSTTASQVITSANADPAHRAGMVFGWSLAAGDVTGDGVADLAVSSPFHGPGDEVAPGMVELFRGRARGLRPVDWSAHGAAADSVLGWAIALADGDGDGRAELSMGAPNDDVNGIENAGVLWTCTWGRTGCGVPAPVVQGAPFGGYPETGDVFASSLTVGDYDADGRDDVVIGAQNEDVGTVVDAGNVSVRYGNGTGQAFHQTDVGQTPEAGDKFGLVPG